MAFYLSAFVQVYQMRKDIPPGSGVKRSRRVGVNLGDKLRECACAMCKPHKDSLFAGEAMCAQFGNPLEWGINRCAMAGIEAPGRFLRQSVERAHIGPDIAIGRRYKCARPAHHMISAEHGPAPFKTQVIPKMARCPYRADHIALDLNCVAIPQRLVRTERDINAFTTARIPCLRKRVHTRGAPREAITKSQNLCPCMIGKLARQRGMIEMRMRDKNFAQVTALTQKVQQCCTMGFIIGTGIYDAQVFSSNDIGIGAIARHGRGVGRTQHIQIRFKTVHQGRGPFAG